MNFTTQWQTFEKEFTVTEQMVTHDGIKPFQTIAWNLAVFKEANTYYFDDIEFSIQRKGAGIPLTPEEKEEILTNELERWIKGMLESCDGYVKAWDVVNEPISGKIQMGMVITTFNQLLNLMITVSPVRISIGRIIWVMITLVFRLSLRVSILRSSVVILMS